MSCCEAVLEEVCTGLRPGSPDNAPIVGPSGIRGLLHATGHYRNGILLAPVTADGIATAVTDGELPDELRPFTAQRFAGAAA
jgi:glycine oxidase